MNPIRLELTSEQFAALGGHITGLRKPLSPLPAAEKAVPEMDHQLIQAGLLDTDRQVKEPFGSLLSALGKTEGMVDLSWTDGGEPTGFSLYSPKTMDGSNPWAPTWIGETASGGVVLRSPFTTPDLQAELQPVLGAGDASTPNVEFGLTASQALVLSALMDLQSPKNTVEESAGYGLNPLAWEASGVLMSMQGAGGQDKRPGYFSVPILALLPPLDWNLENVQHVLNSLVRLGVCTQSGENRFSLSEPIRKTLAGCAVSGNVFWLTLRRSEEDSDEFPETEAEYIGFCSGGTNLVFSWSNGNFHLQTFSRAEVAEMIAKEVFPAVPSLVQSPAALPPVHRPVAPAVRIAATPVKKKKLPTGLIVGLVGVLLVACVLVVVGVVLLLA
jgi:hypothetical protein